MRPAPSRERRPCDAVPYDARSQLRELVRWESSGEHVENAFKDRPREIREGSGAPHHPFEIVNAPRLDSDHRDDLLREHVEWISRIPHLLDRARVHALGERGAGEKIAAELRHDHALARHVNAVSCAADALHAARDGGRRLDLDDSRSAHVVPRSSEESATARAAGPA